MQDNVVSTLPFDVVASWPLLLVIGGAMYLGTDPESRRVPVLLIVVGLALLCLTWGLVPAGVTAWALPRV